MTENLSTRLASARREQGLTQQQIANALGVSRAAVGQWENGITEPSVRNLKALNDLLKVDLRALKASEEDLSARQMSGWRYLFRRRLDKENNVDLPIDMVCVGAKAECLPITGKEGHPVDYVPRPHILKDDEAAFAMLIATDALFPRFEQEEVIYLSSLEKPVESEYAICLVVDSEARIKMYLGRILELNESQITIETFKPVSRQTFPRAWVPKMLRVVPWNELLNDRDDRRERYAS